MLKEKVAIDDVMVCPECKSTNTYEYDTDETEFLFDGTGHYYVDSHCKDCGKNFRLYTEFEYTVTKSWTR